MDEDIRSYARIGLCHHLLFPECVDSAEYHASTLTEFVQWTDMETLDCCLPYGEELRATLVPIVENCGKEVVYTTHLVPLAKIPPATTSQAEQGLVRVVFGDQIALAAAVGATGMVFASGADVPEDERPAARQAFADFARWLCGELRPYDIVPMLEPFDRSVDKKFLYGPTQECVDLIRLLEPDVDSLGLALDVAHVPLLGETFAHAIKTCAPYLKRVHLGNCVVKNPDSPFYGDQHPPIGVDDGEVDVPQVTEILRLLLEVGYLNQRERGALVLEMQPLPNRSPEETVADTMARLGEAWEMVRAPRSPRRTG